MNIQDNFDGHSEYFPEQAAQALERLEQAGEMRKLLSGIKTEAPLLRSLFISAPERKDKDEAAAAVDMKMLAMTLFTFENLNRYQLYGWKTLFDEGGGADEAKPSL